jgi:hypothetical protein
MSDDRYLLEQIVSQEHQKNAPKLKKDEYFEVFSAEQILKMGAFDLDPEQVRSGIVGQVQPDGGVDSLYLFVNRKLIREDTDLVQFKGQQIAIELLITQSKNSGGFQEVVITKLKDFTENCLRLSSDLTQVTTQLYSQALLDVVDRFHTVYRAALSFRPALSIRYFYASLGEQIDPNVEMRKNLLLNKCRELFSTADCSFDFVGAKKLLQWFQRAPTKTTNLETIKGMNWSGFGTAYVCLVQLRKFYEFITDKDKNDALRGHIFEANVRDYQGQVSVNKEIRTSLATSGGSEEFWWLNNGITIIASKVVASGDIFSITDPLIVNGLQTSYEVYSHFRQPNVSDDKRTILVRIVENNNAQSIDRIIKATNSQTSIPRVWLHATEDIQRKIESGLRGMDLYYDRRKNYYRNQGIPATKIVTIPYLAQALATIVLQKPDDARARPTTVAERNYDQLFSDKFPVGLYGKCALILKRADEFLDGVDLENAHRLNMLFYVAMYATCIALKSAKPRRPTIAALDISAVTDAVLEDSYEHVRDAYQLLGGDDKVAKGTALVEKLKSELQIRFGTAKRKKPTSA